MKKGFRWAAWLASALFVAPILVGVAWADPIGPECANDSCFGGTYTLEYSQVDGNTVTVILTADLEDADTNITDIEQVAFKILAGGNTPITGVTLDSFTVDGVDTTGDWGTTAEASKGLSNGGCNTDEGQWVCSPADSPLPLSTGDLYVWTFTVDYDGTLLNGTDQQASLKINFAGDSSCISNGCLLSEPITLQGVPEPATLVLLGSGLLGLGVARRVGTRRRK